jgi:hypothetical protein
VHEIDWSIAVKGDKNVTPTRQRPGNFTNFHATETHQRSRPAVIFSVCSHHNKLCSREQLAVQDTIELYSQHTNSNHVKWTCRSTYTAARTHTHVCRDDKAFPLLGTEGYLQCSAQHART